VKLRTDLRNDKQSVEPGFICLSRIHADMPAVFSRTFPDQ